MEEAPDWIAGVPSDLRRWRDMQPEVLHPVLPADVTLAAVPEVDGGGIECRPVNPVPGGVLHFHGGGFVVGSPYTHRCVGAWIANVLRRPVWLCPWPLAPETALPGQARAAASRLQDAVGRYGSDLIVSGDSAGALMALWAWAFALPETRAKVRSLLLLYGFFGLIEGEEGEGQGLGKGSVQAMVDRLDPSGLLRDGPAYLPLHTGFPIAERVIALGASLDPILQNTRALAEKHRHVQLRMAEGCGHGFLSQVMPQPEALAALRAASAML